MNKWIMNRVGLLNFWYYQKQIFQLSEGKMLLRGSNGSGKSLTMQSLFPVLFDGNTSAYRLDSFGSRDRKMEDYLLGEKGVSNRDDGIGYLFLEVKKENREEYLTIGIGMHANRGGKLSKWFFAIENNHRIGIDFELYEEYRKNEITPLTKQKLKNRLDGIGKLFVNQREYKNYVNERIFGFEKIEQLDELIALLINLRSPKLSKEFNPSAIYGILRDSLPQLKEDELLNLSKTIEQLDGYHERLSDLKLEIKNLSMFSKTYQNWHQELKGQVAGKWLRVLMEKRQIQKDISDKINQQRLLAESLKGYEQDKLNLSQEIEVLTQKLDSLNSHEGIDLARRGEELSQELRDFEQSLINNEDRYQRKKSDLVIQAKQLEELELDLSKLKENLEELLADNEQYFNYVHLDSLDKSYSEKMRTTILKGEFTYWKSKIKERKKHLNEVIQLLKRIDQQKEQLLQLDKVTGELQQKIDECDKDMRQWRQTQQNEIEKWKQQFSLWVDAAPFCIKDQDYFEVLHRVDQLLEEDYREDFILEPLRARYHELLAEKEKETLPLFQKTDDLKMQKHDNLMEIKEWQNKKIPIVPQTKARELSRQQLDRKQVYTLFFQCVEFVEGISEELQNSIEGALFSSGILDSLIANEGLHLSDDCQIFPNPKFYATTLFDYLKVSKEVPDSLQGLIEDILQSITVDEYDKERPAVFKDGSYNVANLKGKMPLGFQASYIGVASQERYRRERIKELE